VTRTQRTNPLREADKAKTVDVLPGIGLALGGGAGIAVGVGVGGGLGAVAGVVVGAALGVVTGAAVRGMLVRGGRAV
jgi:hypothetical protein